MAGAARVLCVDFTVIVDYFFAALSSNRRNTMGKLKGKKKAEKKISRLFPLKTGQLSEALPLKVRETTLFKLESKTNITIFNLENGFAYHIAGAGSYIWFLLDGSMTISEIVAKVCADLNLKSEHSVHEFIEELFSKNLVEVVKKKSKRQYPQHPLAQFVKTKEMKTLQTAKSLKLEVHEVAAGSGGFIGGGTGGCLSGASGCGAGQGGTSNSQSTNMCGCISGSTGS